ncbi:MAG: DnaJ C-terminal domain-containing protein [Dissulfuribacterales bacterium]
MISKDYLEALRTLGLDASATEEEIRQTYRRLMKRLHPDSSSFVDTNRFLQIQQAYERCCSHLRQDHYQAQKGEAALHTDSLADSHEGVDSLQNGTYLFLTVSAQDALFGASKEMWVVDREDFCPRCNGTGLAPPDKNEHKCSRCNGKGSIPMQWGKETMFIVCSACSGTGFISNKTCALCKGRGRVTIKRPLRIHLPRGVKNGMVLKIPGQGPWQAKRYSRDSVFVEVRVEFPEGWRIHGQDLHASLDIDIWTALKGGDVPFRTLEGRWIQVSVPAYAGQSEQDTILIPGYGWINELGQRGNLILKCRLLFPSRSPPETARNLLNLLEQLWPARERLYLPLNEN